MRKKVLAFLLSVVMILSLFPVSAFATAPTLTVTKADGGAAEEGDRWGEAKDYFWWDGALWIGGNDLTITGNGGMVEGGLYILDTVSKVTLNNVKFGHHTGSGIISEALDLTVTLVGDNQIGRAYTYREGMQGNEFDYNYGTNFYGGVTFTGSGNLTIYDYAEGILAFDDIVFDENFSGKVKVEDHGRTEGGAECAITSRYGNIRLLGGTFDLISHEASGIYAEYGDVEIMDAEVNIIFGNADSLYDSTYGIYASATNIGGGATVVMDMSENGDFGIYAYDINIEDEADVSIYGDQTDSCYGINGVNLNISTTGSVEVIMSDLSTAVSINKLTAAATIGKFLACGNGELGGVFMPFVSITTGSADNCIILGENVKMYASTLLSDDETMVFGDVEIKECMEGFAYGVYAGDDFARSLLICGEKSQYGYSTIEVNVPAPDYFVHIPVTSVLTYGVTTMQTMSDYVYVSERVNLDDEQIVVCTVSGTNFTMEGDTLDTTYYYMCKGASAVEVTDVTNSFTCGEGAENGTAMYAQVADWSTALGGTYRATVTFTFKLEWLN